jgi:hypothetical protein
MHVWIGAGDIVFFYYGMNDWAGMAWSFGLCSLALFVSEEREVMSFIPNIQHTADSSRCRLLRWTMNIMAARDASTTSSAFPWPDPSVSLVGSSS